MNKGESPSLGNRDVIDVAKASKLPLRAEADPVLFGLGPPLPVAEDFAWE